MSESHLQGHWGSKEHVKGSLALPQRCSLLTLVIWVTRGAFFSLHVLTMFGSISASLSFMFFHPWALWGVPSPLVWRWFFNGLDHFVFTHQPSLYSAVLSSVLMWTYNVVKILKKPDYILSVTLLLLSLHFILAHHSLFLKSFHFIACSPHAMSIWCTYEYPLSLCIWIFIFYARPSTLLIHQDGSVRLYKILAHKSFNLWCHQ